MSNVELQMNLMLMSENKRFCSLALSLFHVKIEDWPLTFVEGVWKTSNVGATKNSPHRTSRFFLSPYCPLASATQVDHGLRKASSVHAMCSNTCTCTSGVYDKQLKLKKKDRRVWVNSSMWKLCWRVHLNGSGTWLLEFNHRLKSKIDPTSQHDLKVRGN